ncbi:MAG: acyl-CoA synthetase [Burkholderiales bacterium]|nr:acyl-CoA synthetase [Burkholderiales bacterium]
MTPDTRAWTEQPERSNLLALRGVAWFAKTFGRTAARALLAPICLYFLWRSTGAREASAAFLARVNGRKASWIELYRHHHTFAATILDRVFFLLGRTDDLDLRYTGEAIVADLLGAGRGCFLVGAHFGSFESIRAMGRRVPDLDVRLAMYEANARRIGTVLRSIDPSLGLRIIALGTPQSMLRIRDALDAGAFVGMLADRRLGDEAGVPLDFLGAPVRFPLGPFRLARILDRPVVLMFGIHRGGNRYDIVFERTPPDVDAATLAAHFAARLEHHVRSAPFNWFNFHDFWA